MSSMTSPAPGETRAKRLRLASRLTDSFSPGQFVAIRRPRKTPLRAWIRRVHLWATLSLGLLLLVVTTSGAAIVLEPEINRLVHAELYHSYPGPATIGLNAAVGIVRQAYPDHHIHYVTPPRRGDRYLIEVDQHDHPIQLFVDPVDGSLHGPLDPLGGPMGWLSTLHTSLFVGESTLPGTNWLVSQALLGISALALLLMVGTGAVLWWPGVKRFVRNGFGVRLGRNGYTTNLDLHKGLGFIALLPLLLWGLTGANFEFYEQTRPIWYALTPGDAPPDVPVSASQSGGGPGMTAETAVQRALAAAPGARFSSVVPPTADADYYSVWLARGIDTYEYFDWPGTFEVRVDRTNGDVLALAYTNYSNLTTEIYEGWTFSLHTGAFAPWYLRIAWMVIGFAPVALAVTGVGMWWLKRRLGRRAPRFAAASESALLAPAD